MDRRGKEFCSQGPELRKGSYQRGHSKVGFNLVIFGVTGRSCGHASHDTLILTNHFCLNAASVTGKSLLVHLMCGAFAVLGAPLGIGMRGAQTS